MRVRYVTMRRPPRAWIDDYGDMSPTQPTITVHEAADEPEDTGLLDADGDPLYRVTVRQPIGFMRNLDDE